jgi:hypothetical protein
MIHLDARTRIVASSSSWIEGEAGRQLRATAALPGVRWAVGLSKERMHGRSWRAVERPGSRSGSVPARSESTCRVLARVLGRPSL